MESVVVDLITCINSNCMSLDTSCSIALSHSLDLPDGLGFFFGRVNVLYINSMSSSWVNSSNPITWSNCLCLNPLCADGHFQSNHYLVCLDSSTISRASDSSFNPSKRWTLLRWPLLLDRAKGQLNSTSCSEIYWWSITRVQFVPLMDQQLNLLISNQFFLRIESFKL